MIERYFSDEAVILKYSTTGEINRQFTYISPLYGIQSATAYGAEKLKSRFCPSIQNFVSANLFLDRNPKTGLLKLDDISNVDTNDFIKQKLEYIYLLSFFSDILLNTYISNDEYKSFYFLLKYSMEILKYKNDIKSSFLFFTSKYFLLSGYGLNLKGCRKCGMTKAGFYFDFQSHGVLCGNCTNSMRAADAADRKYSLSENSLFRWKYYFESRYKEMKDEIISAEDFKEIFPIVIEILTNVFNRELKTFNSVRNIF